jgi:hypothetical protein
MVSALRVLFFTLALAMIFAGCRGSQGPERVVVSGTANYNGKPIADGHILFSPTTALPIAAGTIVNGKYKVDGLGGVPVGRHKVQFEAFRTDPLSGKDPQRLRFGDTVRLQYLPAKFNTDSQLEITIPSGSGPIVKDFDLKD